MEEEKKYFIGRFEIDHIEELTDSTSKVVFVSTDNEDGSKTLTHEDAVLHPDLLDIVKSETKLEDADVTDIVRHKLATYILTELSDLGLSFEMLFSVTDGAQTLASNLREKKIGEAFGCASSRDIPLTKLL